MFGKLLGPATFDERRTSRGEGQVSKVDLIPTSISILPEGARLSDAFLYAGREDCAFDLTDPALYRGNVNDVRSRPRVSFDLLDGKAVNVQIVQ